LSRETSFFSSKRVRVDPTTMHHASMMVASFYSAVPIRYVGVVAWW
jgi:hypothetical protein